MNDEKVCTWCGRVGHHANHCPDPKPPASTVDLASMEVITYTDQEQIATARLLIDIAEALKFSAKPKG